MSVLDVDKKITYESMVKMGLSPVYSNSFVSEWLFRFVVDHPESRRHVYLLKFVVWRKSGVCNPTLTTEIYGFSDVPISVKKFPALTDETELFAFFEDFKNKFYWPYYEHIRS